VIYYDEGGKIQAVGNRAKTLKSIDPKHIVYSFKRLMGRGKSDLPEISKELPFDFSETTDEIIRIKCAEKVYTPIELSAEILKRCKFVAENQLGGPVRRAVVTVPAYFNDAQRAATSLAGKLAGLEVVRILNEPTAAALAFGLGKSSEQKLIAVYDFGGGTFDISILKITGSIFEVVSTAGDTRLGGDDLDEAIFEWLCRKIEKRPEHEDDSVLFKTQIERLKIALSEIDEAEATFQWGNQIQWSGVISRAEVDKVLLPIVERTIRACKDALEAVSVKPETIDEVVLVGGSSRIPLVRRRVTEFFGRTPNVSQNPEQVVALGAGIQASILSGKLTETLLLDVVPLSLGLETIGGVVSKIIQRNSTIPVSATERFTTYQDFQTGVDFHIVQGEREFAKDCRSLGRFKLKIPRAPAGSPKIRVTFMMDADGILRVKAQDEKSGDASSLEVRPSFGLSDLEVEKMLQDAVGHAEGDFKERALVESRSQALTLIHSIEKLLLNPLLDEDFRRSQDAKLSEVMTALREDVKGKSAELILMRTKELDQLTIELAQYVLTKSIRLANQPVERVSV
jgi:molecular chaperone DnaK (HSP70)